MPASGYDRIRPAIVALLLAATAGAQQSAKAPAPTSTSVSGQFVIHGADLETRGHFSRTCDDVAEALGRLLRDDARYTLPVVIVLKSPQDAPLSGPAVSWNISQLAHGGFHLQINATLRPDFRGDDFARDLVRVLLAERILRGHKELNTSRQNVLPNWVLTGVTHALEFRSRSRPSSLFAAVFHSGQIYSIDKVLSANPAQLDALARGVYETSSCALVLALLDQPDGSLRFLKFLEALAREDKSDREVLRRLFPTLGASKNSLEKWWSLQMATLATPSPLETLGIDETEAGLRDALTLVFKPLPDKKKRKSDDTAPVKKTDTQETSGEQKSKSIFAPSSPLIGGKKILNVPADDSGTDGGGPARKKTEDQKSPEKTPQKKAAAKPEDAKEEPAKLNKLDPRNWFRGKAKSDEEPKRSDSPKKTGDADHKNLPVSKPDPAGQSPAKDKQEARDPSEISLPLDEFATIWSRSDRDKIFQRTISRLSALKVRAHPLYRALIGEYIAAVRVLITGKQKGVSDKLAGLRGQHAVILELARAVESHMDWYEASRTKSYSGVFDDYLKLGDQIDQEKRVRHDALSTYLDTLAKEYER